MINSHSLPNQKNISTSSLHIYPQTCIFAQMLYLISWYSTWKILLFFSLATFTSLVNYTIIYFSLITNPMSIMLFSFPLNQNLFAVLSYTLFLISFILLIWTYSNRLWPPHSTRNILRKVTKKLHIAKHKLSPQLIWPVYGCWIRVRSIGVNSYF